MNDATRPDQAGPHRRRLPEVPFLVVFALTVTGWILRSQTGLLQVLSVVLIGAALLLWAAPEINKALDGDRLSWRRRALARWRSLSRAIRTITVCAVAFLVALGVFMWAIGVRIDTWQVIRDNSWILVVLIGAVVVGFVKALDAADKRAAARRDS